jgi:hypothetical protein
MIELSKEASKAVSGGNTGTGDQGGRPLALRAVITYNKKKP